MKIIMIPNDPVWRGRHLYLANALVEQGHEVHYLMWDLPYGMKPSALLKHLFTSLIVKHYTHDQFKVHTSRRLPYFWPYINGWLFKHQLRSLYRKIGADLIITESYTNETEVPRDLPFIYDLADNYAGPADVYGGTIYKLAFKLLDVRGVMRRQCENALAVTAVSEILYKYAKLLNGNTAKVPNGVDHDRIIKTVGNTSAQAKNPHSIVYMTNFGQWSRAIETLQTITRLRKDYPDIDLTLIGPGVEADNIRMYIQDNKADKYIHYLGQILDRDRLYSLLNQCAIGLNISDKNTWRDAACPIKVIEYTALGKRVVSTDLAEVKNFKFPNVFLFSDESVDDSLEAVLRHALDDKQTYGVVAKRVTKNYDWNILVDQMLSLVSKAKVKGTKK
jgi:glycosyltransferase involved in cell wall biosynthesis